MHTGESIIESLIRKPIPVEEILKLALNDIQSNIATAQLELEKHTIENLENMSTDELIKLLRDLQSKLQSIQYYLKHLQLAQRQLPLNPLNNTINASQVIIGLVRIFEEVIITNFELGNLNEACKNIQRIIGRRNNHN